MPLVDLKYTLGTISPATAGSVRADSVTGAVGSVTGAVGSVTGAVGSVTAAVSLSAGDSPVLQSGTATAGGGSTITIQTAIGADSLPNGCIVKITSGTGAKQARGIIGYVDATKVVTVDRAWTTNPDNTSVYTILYEEVPKLDTNLKVAGVVLADTVTNLTNAASAGDLTATMKTSVTTAATAATPTAAAVTGNVGGNVTGSIGSLAAQAKTDVNTEVLDVINVDTYTEPGQEAPPVTTTIQKKVSYLYKFMRNKVTQTSTTLSVFADDASTVDQKATVSDDGTTYTRGEIASGP